MRPFVVFLALLFISADCYCQRKGANTIKVIGVTFKEVANKLLDAGYTFDKIDSNYQTIRTSLQHGLIMDLRVKDSTLILKGWYKGNSENLEPVVYGGYMTGGFFKVENIFALSFKKPVEYSISK